MPGTSNNYFTSMMILGTTEVSLPSSYNYTSSGSLTLGSSFAVTKFNVKYSSSGSLTLGSSFTVTKFNVKYISSGSLTLGSSFTVKNNSSILINYILSGPKIINLDFNNSYYNFNIIDDFNEEFQIKITSDKNIDFYPNNIIKEKNHFYLENFPVGDYKISIESLLESIKLNGNELNIRVVSSNSKEGLHPKISFKIDFNIEDLNNNVSDFKTVSVPLLNKTLKHNDIFVLYGNDATYFKNNILPQYKDLIKII